MSEVGAAQEPLATIRASSGWSALNLAEAWQFRDLLLTMAKRDLMLRYRQTALGAVWVVLQPLMAAGVFSFVFGKVAGLEAPGHLPYFVFSYVGLLGWNLFSGTLSRTSGSMVGNAHLISKVFFPRLILPLSGLPSSLVDFGVASAMLAMMLVWFAIAPGWGIVLVPLWMAILVALALGIGLVSAALAVTYRDVLYVLPVMTQILLYASPVAYGVDRVPEKLRPLYFVNPLTAPFEAFRWSVLGIGELPLGGLAWSASVATMLLVAGAFCFKRMERRFADII